jgi:XTP/dITP diphosphohydrolase
LVTSDTTEDDLGEMLVAIVAAARDQGLDAERALRTAVRRVIDASEG